MAVINTEEKMHDVGEMREDYDGPCCVGESDTSTKKMKKSYPTMYLYEIPDELFNSFTVGQEVELKMKVKVKETTERATNREDKGEKIRRTVDLEIREVSNPQ